MTDKEQLIIERMQELSIFQDKMGNIEVCIRDASADQNAALNSLYDAIDNLVLADAKAIGVIDQLEKEGY